MDDRIDNEVALREEITALNERIASVRRQLGALENEVRKREGEFIAIRSGQWLDDNE